MLNISFISVTRDPEGYNEIINVNQISSFEAIIQESKRKSNEFYYKVIFHMSNGRKITTFMDEKPFEEFRKSLPVKELKSYC